MGHEGISPDPHEKTDHAFDEMKAALENAPSPYRYFNPETAYTKGEFDAEIDRLRDLAKNAEVHSEDDRKMYEKEAEQLETLRDRRFPDDNAA